MTGSVGLEPTLAALEAGTTLALANKESLIVGGELVTGAAKPGQLVPVDSEHSALAQALRGESIDDVRRLIVTASGGPFRGRTRAELADVTPEQAMAHPTWDMGPVITINSATLVNKGLEVIEAHLLFDIGFDRIDVVVHPHVGRPLDGRVRRRLHDGAGVAAGHEAADRARPGLARAGARRGRPVRLDRGHRRGSSSRSTTRRSRPSAWRGRPASSAARRPAVFNAANEVCVDAFVAGDLDFLGIVDTVGAVLEEHISDPDVAHDDLTLASVLEADARARERARALVE